MPRGDKSAYTSKQKRMAAHIEKGYEHRGVKRKEAERRAWATVNKETGGGKKKKSSGTRRANTGRSSGARKTSSARKSKSGGRRSAK